VAFLFASRRQSASTTGHRFGHFGFDFPFAAGAIIGKQLRRIVLELLSDWGAFLLTSWKFRQPESTLWLFLINHTDPLLIRFSMG
jgi:hypothetical protein